MKSLAVIINPCAGQKRANHFIFEIVSEFCKFGYRCSIHPTLGQGDGRTLASELAPVSDIIVCIGGDGTLSEVVSGILSTDSRTALGYIPSGSTNDFALSVGVPRGIISSARNCMTGVLRAIDVGLFNDRNFIYVASFGAFTSTSYSTSQTMKNTWGHMAYLIEGLRELSQVKPFHLRIETDRGVYDDDYIFGAFANSTSIGGILTLEDSLVSINDGRFEMFLIKNPQNAGQLNQIITALNRRDLSCPFITLESVSRADVTCYQETKWSLDGEFAESKQNVQISVLRQAVDIILPATGYNRLFVDDS